MRGSPYGGTAVGQSGGYDGMSAVQRANAGSLEQAGQAPQGGPAALPSQEDYQRDEELKHARLSGYLAGKLGDDPDKLEAKGASSGKGAHDAIKVAVSHAWNWLATGRADGTPVKQGVFPGRDVNPGEAFPGRKIDRGLPTGGPDGPVSQSELAAFKGADQASGGPKNGVDTPTVRAPGRPAPTGGRGNSRTKTSPSVTTGPSPVTAAPRSSDPNDSDTSMDPALKEMKGLLDHYKDGSRDGVDLSPMMALADSWGGSHLLKGYERPMNEHDREKLRLGLTEQMAKRQSDLEWHRDRMQMNRDTIQGRNDVAGTNADAKGYTADTRAHSQILHDQSRPAPKGRPVPPGGIDPDEKALKALNQGRMDGVIRDNYSGDPKAMAGAKQDVHDWAWQKTQLGVAASAHDPVLQRNYPGLMSQDEAQYKAAVRQMYEHYIGDVGYVRPTLRGMRAKPIKGSGGGGEDGGEGGN